MRDPEILAAYYRESGTARPVPPTRHGLAKAEGDSYAEQGGAVERRAAQLEKSEGLTPTRAYAKALSQSGAYSGAGAAA